MLIAFGLLVVGGALAFFFWVVKSMLHTECGNCRQAEDSREFVIPIIPGIRWFCPSCGGIYTREEINKISDE